MKVLVEHKETGKFLMEFGEWTRDMRQAKDFKQTTAAIRHCVQANLSAVGLLLTFGMDRRLDARLDPFSRNTLESQNLAEESAQLTAGCS